MMNPDDYNETPSPKTRTQRIIGINLLIILVSTTMINIGFNKVEYENAFYNCALVTLHTFACVVMCIYYILTSKRTEGQAYLLAAFIVLLVGFSSCLGGHALLS